MTAAAAVRVRMLNPRHAAARLAGLAELDPRGMATEADTPGMCQAGLCVEVEQGDGSAVVVIRLENGVAWIDAAAGSGGVDLCSAINQAAEELPATSIAFQTRRPGLVKRAQSLGYEITGYILRRKL